MHLWIGLHLPRLPLEVFCPAWPADAPGAAAGDARADVHAGVHEHARIVSEHARIVFEHARVLAVSSAAEQAGARIGMRSGGVQLLLPTATRHERDLARETTALHACALAMLRYSPLLTVAEDATLLIDVGASLTLFGGVRALCRRMRADLRAMGFSVSLGCAPTARGAWLLAGRQDDGKARGKHNTRRVLTLPGLRRELDRLPMMLAPPARPFLDLLDGIACHHLGDARRLPRPGLIRRCGQPLLDLLDCAYGSKPELFDWLVAAPDFKARIELFDRVEHGAALQYGAQRLLLQMTGWLCARQLAVKGIVIALEHERGRVALAPTMVAIELSEATWKDEHLLRLLREKLPLLTLAAPVIAMSLTAGEVEPMAPPSASLFPEPGGTPADRRRLLELLVARLGADNVLQPAPHADYRPEAANAWAPLTAKNKPHPPSPPALLARPGWLLAKPQALSVQRDRPYYGAPLILMSAPERIEAGWWDGACARDYFVAEGRDHALYWIYRERGAGADAGGAGQAGSRWYLHGLFG